MLRVANQRAKGCRNLHFSAFHCLKSDSQRRSRMWGRFIGLINFLGGHLEKETTFKILISFSSAVSHERSLIPVCPQYPVTNYLTIYIHKWQYKLGQPQTNTLTNRAIKLPSMDIITTAWKHTVHKVFPFIMNERPGSFPDHNDIKRIVLH